MKPKHKRLSFVVLGLAILGVAAVLVLNALEEGIVFFHSPSEIAEKDFPADRRIRIGGLVEEGSVKRSGGSVITFAVTDLVHSVPVRYDGLLPDLFREGQGVVAEGHLRGGVFEAEEVLAKHDENYMPPEAADALKEAGVWQHMKETMEAGKAAQ